MLGNGAFERGSITCRPPWVYKNHNVSIGREVLELRTKVHVVHCVRTSVDLEQQRIVALRIEIRWFDHPALNTRTAAGVVPNLLGLGEGYASQQFVIEVGELLHGLRAVRIDQYDVAGRTEGRPNRRNRAFADREA